MTIRMLSVLVPLVVWGCLLVNCGDSSSPAPRPAEAGAAASPGTAQTPPMGEGAVIEWLATGQYKSWHCEPAVHAARGPSVHTPFDRVCSNDVLSAAADAGAASWPAGAAEVKEIYMAMGDTQPTGGYAVSMKTSPDSAGGANWYYYERFDGTLYADGLGVGICVGCHGAAGTDAPHTTTAGARDFVFTPVH